MEHMKPRHLAVDIALRFLGTPYIWGGDDPSGFDCSGFVIELLKSVGKLPRGYDSTAAQLFGSMVRWEALLDNRGHRAVEYFEETSSREPVVELSHPRAGCLAFFARPHPLPSDSHRIVHVEMLVTPALAIGASGGGSTVTTPAEAWRRNAYIKIRPWAGRRGATWLLDPFMAGADNA